MKICFVQIEDYHTEVLGFFIQNFINDELYLYHPHYHSPFNSVSFYQKAFDKTVSQVDSVIEDMYDMIVILTSREHKLFNIKNKNKYLLICHVNTEVYDDFLQMSLTPLIEKTSFCNLPVYYIENNETRKNIIGIIGLSRYNIEKKDIFDLYGFVKKTVNYQFFIYSRPEPKLIMFFSSLPNITFRSNCPTENMITELKCAKFIMTVDKEGQFYQTTGLSGSIPLALSLNVPLIMSEKLNNIYELYGVITYDKTAHEIVDTINQIDDTVYNQLLQYFGYCRNALIENNFQTCQNLRNVFINIK